MGKLSPAEAAAFVAQRWGDRAGSLDAVGEGSWSVAYGFTLDGQERVIRFGAHSDDFARDARARTFRRRDLPVPAVLEIGPTPSGFYALAERAHGVALDHLDGDGMRRVLPSLLRTLDALASVDVSDTEGFGGWDAAGRGAWSSATEALLRVAGDDPAHRTHGWSTRVAEHPGGRAVFDAGFGRLRALLNDLPPRRGLIHGDLFERNVLVADDHICAVLDWGCSAYGDPLYDAAWLLHWWPWHEAWSRIDIRAELDGHWSSTGGSPVDVEARLRCFQLHIGLDHIAWSAWVGDGTLPRHLAQVEQLLG